MRLLIPIGWVVLAIFVVIAGIVPFDPHFEGDGIYLCRRLLFIAVATVLPFVLPIPTRGLAAPSEGQPISRARRVLPILLAAIPLVLIAHYGFAHNRRISDDEMDRLFALTRPLAVAAGVSILFGVVRLASRLRLTRDNPPSSVVAATIGTGMSITVLVTAIYVALVPIDRFPCAGNETAAIGSLRTIVDAQVTYRAGDRDGDGVADYATSLEELSHVGLIDDVLGAGIKSGYVFTFWGSADEWACSATPYDKRTGKRNFVVCTDGVVRYSRGEPADCSSRSIDY